MMEIERERREREEQERECERSANGSDGGKTPLGIEYGRTSA
jgi:hypothetical protein